MSTNFAEILGELNGGVYEQQINRALSDIAANVCTHGKKGQLILTFNVEQIADSNQIKIGHSIKSTVPKARGRVIEETEADTPMHVGAGGAVPQHADQDGPGGRSCNRSN